MSKRPHVRNNRCGAKTRKGTPCKNGAMPNGRCRLHGGKSTGPPKKNQNSKKHGFYSKYLPEDAQEIINDMQGQSASDLIYSQIEIQFAAIIRAQKIMYVKDSDDNVQFLTKRKESDFGDEEAFEHHAAWDRHATFMNAQSRAMSELRSLIKQFNELVHEDDERLLRVKQVVTNIIKTEKETEFLEERTKLIKGTKKDTSLLEALIDVVNEDE